MAGRRFALFMCMALLGNAFAVPTEIRRRRQVTEKTVGENEVSSQEISVSMKNYGQDASTTESPNTYLPATQSSRGDTPAAPSAPDDDDDDDDFRVATAQTSGGGSSIFSLLNLISALFPGSSGSNVIIRNMIRQFIIKYQHIIFPQLSPRKSVADNEIELDYDLKPPPVRQELQDSESEDDASGTEEESDENDGAEESGENNGNGHVDSKQESNGDDDASDYDSDEPPGGGDGQGGGILGLLAGLSGGEDGQSDLGSLLATVSGIVANLSGDGIDVNALIASGLGLFVGLLSEGNENPGAVVASYLTTSLDSLSGGGSKNNGAFFGAFLSKLLAGTSGALQDSSEENGDKKPMIDSAGFFASFLMALLGDLSKGSSGGAWR